MINQKIILEIKVCLKYLINFKMVECCECGKEVDENSEEAVMEVPFGEEILSFCSKNCYDEGKI